MTNVLAGADFDGNLYFERLVPGAYRPRRHVIYREQLPLSEYSDRTIPVQWQAWMRHTRARPPTLAELAEDTRRQEALAANVERLAARTAAPGLQAAPDKQLQQAVPGQSAQPESWAPGTSGRDHGRRGQ
ncbi:hypothetical protein H4R19_004124 [Coemansia spiralis]|nr:hypothetical protein H4R19_004124 [Coemansia spiralis]